MIFDDLAKRYGPYLAEVIRQAMTLEEFEKHEAEELLAYFELKEARLYEEYHSRLSADLPAGSPSATQEEYLNVLRRRWEKAREMAGLLQEAESNLRLDSSLGDVS